MLGRRLCQPPFVLDLRQLSTILVGRSLTNSFSKKQPCDTPTKMITVESGGN